MLTNYITQCKVCLNTNWFAEMIKFGLYKTLIRPVMCYGSVRWTLRQLTKSYTK